MFILKYAIDSSCESEISLILFVLFIYLRRSQLKNCKGRGGLEESGAGWRRVIEATDHLWKPIVLFTVTNQAEQRPSLQYSAS